jgi:alpha-L-arabinofuranosidase
MSPDKLHLAIDIINRSQTAPVATSIDCGQFRPQTSAHLLSVSGENYDANNGADLPDVPFFKWPDQVAATHNPQLNKGKPGTITIKESAMNISGNRFKIDLAPLSITRIELDRASK